MQNGARLERNAGKMSWYGPRTGHRRIEFDISADNTRFEGPIRISGLVCPAFLDDVFELNFS